jgi:hypothetical protein
VKRVVTFGELMLRLSPPGDERLFQSPQPSQSDFPWCDSQNPSFGVEWPFYYSYHPDDTRKAATWLLSCTKKSARRSPGTARRRR